MRVHVHFCLLSEPHSTYKYSPDDAYLKVLVAIVEVIKLCWQNHALIRLSSLHGDISPKFASSLIMLVHRSSASSLPLCLTETRISGMLSFLSVTPLTFDSFRLRTGLADPCCGLCLTNATGARLIRTEAWEG